MLNSKKKNQVNFIYLKNIVPTALLEHYISMTEPSKAQTIDGELSRHCAFTLPGVVLALGRENWNCLKDIYNLLSSDMQVIQCVNKLALQRSFCKSIR